MISIPKSLFNAEDAAEIAEEAGVEVRLAHTPHIILSPAVAADLWESAAAVIEAILAGRAEEIEFERSKAWRADLDPEIKAIYAKIEAAEAEEKAPRRRAAAPLPTDEDRDRW